MNNQNLRYSLSYYCKEEPNVALNPLLLEERTNNFINSPDQISAKNNRKCHYYILYQCKEQLNCD